MRRGAEGKRDLKLLMVLLVSTARLHRSPTPSSPAMPPASKRKRDPQDEGSDSEEMAFGKQILPVADLPADFDGEPMDGLQYLFTVRYVISLSSTPLS